MKHEVNAWLEDIKQAIEEIKYFLKDISTFADFENDSKTRRAVERDLEIIGEAIGRILQLEPNIEISNARKIVDTRNRIIHGYGSVSYEIIWAVVTQDLVLLYAEITSLL